MTGKAPVEIVRNQLVLGPVTVDFQRTLRIPEKGVRGISLHDGPRRSIDSDVAATEQLGRPSPTP